MDIDALWEYTDPAASESRFIQALAETTGDAQLELLSQIARTFSLRGRFAEAHERLDQLEAQLNGASERPKVRYYLERGRTHNAAGEHEMASYFFNQAWELASHAGLVGLAVDAAHMLAISNPGSEQALDWNQRGLALARSSDDPKAQALIPAMLNNAAWDFHERGEFAEALALFNEAEQAWISRERPRQIQIARWSVARCLRSLGEYQQALDLQQALAAELQAAEQSDGFVFEEIGENLAALGEHEAAKPYFEQALNALAQDPWFVQHEAARLLNLKIRAGKA
ncbi:hypothetical protein [Herpetosiphon geysericola]|uniref:MalT-like TPR region domain-containing protein n=1 Tax=Herpetosiphon geysericola TaxID=70996 RepID=A0A0P6YG94_9CHLR|nr:hypothetical protein [Herpetosiphon geysericola]KPL81255.1 hypothetical protein SE18_21490 [Herpetosiphon geysericola]